MRYATGDWKKAKVGYLDIYKAIEKQKEYDEAALISAFEGKAYTGAFAIVKKNLTNVILKVLKNYEPGFQDGVSGQIAEIKILLERRIFELARKRLPKAKAQARGEERFAVLLELMAYEERLLLEDEELKDFDKQIEQLLAERERILVLWQNLQQFEGLFQQYFLPLHRGHSSWGDIDGSLVDSLSNHELLDSESRALTNRARRLFHLFNATAYQLLGEDELQFRHLDALKSLYDRFPHLLEDYGPEYLECLGQFATLLFKLGRYDEGLGILNELRKVKFEEWQFDFEIFDQYFLGMLSYADYSGDLDKGIRTGNDIRKGMERFEGQFRQSRWYLFYFMLAKLCYRKGKYEEAAAWIRNVIDHPVRGVGEDVQSLSRILNLVIHFDAQDVEGFDLYARKTRYYLFKDHALYDLEKRILKFFKGFPARPGRLELEVAFENLRMDMEELMKGEVGERVKGYFDFQGWVEAKLGG